MAVTPGFWFRKVAPFGADWTPGEPPAVTASLAPVAGYPLRIVAIGSNGTLRANFTGPFIGTPPAGFLPGAPVSGFDPSTAQGSALVSGISNNAVDFPIVPGYVETFEEMPFGAYYFEFTFINVGLFTFNLGMGIARHGSDINQFTANGRFSASDQAGGALVKADHYNTFAADVESCGTNYVTGGLNLIQGIVGQPDIVGVAFFITPNQPQIVLRSQEIQCVPLPCIPCCTFTLPCDCWPPHKPIRA